MSKVFKPRRGSANQVAAFVGEANEVILNTTTNTLHVMDGLTAGGFPLARADEVVNLTGNQTVRGEKTFIAEEIYLSTSGMENGEDRQFRVGSTSSFGQRRNRLGGKSTFLQHDPGTGESGIRGIVIDGRTASLDHDTPSGADGRELVTAAFVRQFAGKSVGDRWEGYDPASVPANVQLYSGQLLSRSAYEAHSELVFSGKRTVVSEEEWQSMVAERGWCPWYSEGDGSTTYRFPLVKGVFAEYVASLSEAGQYKEAGAPNIRASAGGVQGRNPTASGSFSVTVGTASSWSGNTSGLATYDFDASLSSPVYRDDIDTIQPPALTHLIGEYVVGSVAMLGEADAESLLASVTTLESNVGALENSVGRASAYIVETWHEGTEWYRRWSDGWIEQGGFVLLTNVTLSSGQIRTDTITLPVEMADTNYSFKVASKGGSYMLYYNDSNETPRTTTTLPISTKNWATVNGKAYGFEWEVRGYAKA